MQDLSIFLSTKSLIVYILVLSRITGMIVTAPVFSTFPVPMQAKAGFIALISFIMYPFVLQSSDFQIPTEMITLSVLIFKEIFVGILIGFSASLFFTGIQMGGQLLSNQMGLTVANTLDPVTKQNVPVIGQFYLFMATMLFISLNGYHTLFECVFQSYNSMPIGLNFEFTPAITEKLLHFTSYLFTIAFQIIMPVFGILFVLDVALAFVSKMMPQMNIFMVSIPLKIYVGLMYMSLFMTTTAVYTSNLMQNFFEMLKSIFS